MRTKIISFLKRHPTAVNLFWTVARMALSLWGLFVPVQPKTMLFASFGGRKFDDSPKAIYDEICRRPGFSDWKLIWAFVDPEQFQPPRGEKVRMDTPAFFHALLSSRVWVSNTGMDRGIGLTRKKTVKVETWHGAPLKKICGEEHTGSMGGQRERYGGRGERIIRCAQSEYDRDIFQRLFRAEKSDFLLCGLPRNDALLRYTPEDVKKIRAQLCIPAGKRVILYTPTYREYLLDEHNDTYIAPPMDLAKWERLLGEEYVLLFRAHYAVTAALKLTESDFVRDVSAYPTLNDLYAAADIMISDYSSTFFDYAILERPMLCFAYDLEEYEEKRGLYLDLEETLPCPVDREVDTLLERIQSLDTDAYSRRAKEFHRRFTPHDGHAARAVVEEVERRLSL